MSQPLDLDAIRARADALRDKSPALAGHVPGSSAADVPALIAALTDTQAEVERLRAALGTIREQAGELATSGLYNLADEALAAVSHTEETPQP